VNGWLGSGGARRWPQWHLRDLGGDGRAAVAVRGLVVALLLSSAIITGLSVWETAADQSHESTSVVVRINDRGLYVGERVIDLSHGAAQAVSMTEAGIAPVKLDVLPSI
jgi:hypothetical protein